MDPQPPRAAQPVPWRTIVATVAVVLGVIATWGVLSSLHRIVSWIVIAAFVAVVLNPAVDFLEHRGKLRRGLATLLVFIVGIAVFSAMMYAFIRPIVDQSQEFASNFPEYVADA